MANPIHPHHDLIIVGGGIWGCAIAYYFIRNNPGSKVLLLERNELCNAATSRAAALVTRIRAKQEFIPLAMETYRVIPELEAILGEKLFFKRNGVLHVAASPSTESALTNLISIAQSFGDPVQMIKQDQIPALSPWLNATPVTKAALFTEEAYCDPYLLGTFFARAATALGAVLKQGVAVEQVLQNSNKATGVITTAGNFYADKIVIASGVWTPVLAGQLGESVPMAPVRSQYWITEKNILFPPDSPTVILPDAQAYARPEGNSLLFGIREKKSLYASPEKVPADISNYVFSADKGMTDLEEMLEQLAQFFPSVYDIGIQYYMAGFSGYTPDNYLSIGPAKNFDNILLAAGCVGAGISVCGGVGLAFAEMAAGRTMPYDLSAFRLDRFGAIDPLSDDWLQKCALARSQKRSG